MTESPSVRDLVNGIRNEVRAGELLPGRAADLAAQLSALLGNISAEIRKADMAFNVVYLRCLSEHKAANRARVHAEVTPEYQEKREANDLFKVAVEMIRSLRKLQDTYREEMRLTK